VILTVVAGVTEMSANHNGGQVSSQLLDTAGQEVYCSVVLIYFHGVCGAVLEQSSFADIPYWMDEIGRHAQSDIAVIVVANKVDRPPHEWALTKEAAKGWATGRKLPMAFASAKTGEHVRLLIGHIVTAFVCPSHGAFPGDTYSRAASPTCC
jgi:GTPase SAR1 family protein